MCIESLIDKLVLSIESQGYGAIMDSCSRQWYLKLQHYRYGDGKEADISSGAFVSGPCLGTCQRLEKELCVYIASLD